MEELRCMSVARGSGGTKNPVQAESRCVSGSAGEKKEKGFVQVSSSLGLVLMSVFLRRDGKQDWPRFPRPILVVIAGVALVSVLLLKLPFFRKLPCSLPTPFAV